MCVCVCAPMCLPPRERQSALSVIIRTETKAALAANSSYSQDTQTEAQQTVCVCFGVWGCCDTILSYSFLRVRWSETVWGNRYKCHSNVNSEIWPRTLKMPSHRQTTCWKFPLCAYSVLLSIHLNIHVQNRCPFPSTCLCPLCPHCAWIQIPFQPNLTIF